MIQSINPANGQLLQEYEPLGNEVIEQKIGLSRRAFLDWRYSKLNDRLQCVANLANILLEDITKYGQVISLEMGKLIKESTAEVDKCARLCEFYVTHAKDYLADIDVQTNFKQSYISFLPIGTVLGIMPWNYPFWQVFRFAVPSLLVGNTTLLKHASNVPQCGELIEEIFLKAGFPKGCLQNLQVPGDQLADTISHPLVKAVTLTGSNKAGKAVAKLAGEHLKKTVLELGGNDPYLILEDADIDLAVEKCVKSRILNAGQSCIGAKRFIIVKEVYDEFLEKFKAKLEQLKPGCPFDENTSLAPLATENILRELHQQVIKSIKIGAKCLLGGSQYQREGFYYQPTILTEVAPGMPAYHEELFGPVASMIKVNGVEEAILVANDTHYGLGAAVFSNDLRKAQAIAQFELNAGNCFVNDFVKSDPRLPFGGINQSGYGRELSHFGLFEFANIKTICVN